jgi:hypothetical protein
MSEPITIKGGGSVEITFDDTEFPPGNGKKHYNATRKITSLEVRDDNSGQVQTCSIPSNGKCTITVNCD